jgi:prevent-host-death family protein
MIRTHDIHSLTDFQRNTREHIERLKETGRPAVLTVNGKAEVVVQSAEAYQELLDALERAEAQLDVYEGFEAIERGEKGRSIREVAESIRARARKGAA